MYIPLDFLNGTVNQCTQIVKLLHGIHSQTGAFYVDPVDSFLKLTVTHTVTGATSPATGAKGFGSGSACYLFSRIVVSTRSGKELTKVAIFFCFFWDIPDLLQRTL